MEKPPRDPLANASIRILDGEVVLIHIPLHHYGKFVNPILHLVSPIHGDKQPFVPDAYVHPFVVISLTTVECSIICPREASEQYFLPARTKLGVQREDVIVSEEDYLVLLVDGIGFEAAERIAELTAPLAQEGVPIFFISTHSCDYILAPVADRNKVVTCLEKRGFQYQKNTANYTNSGLAPPSPARGSSTGDYYSPSSLTAPMDIRKPGSSKFPTPDLRKPQPVHSIYAQPRVKNSERDQHPLSILQRRTFKLIKDHDITPLVEPTLYLLQAGAKSDRTTATGVFSVIEKLPEPRGAMLFKAIARNLMPQPGENTRFFSVCLTTEHPASFWIESSTLSEWHVPIDPKTPPKYVDPGEGPKSLLSCDPKQVFLPLTLDLRGISGGMEKLTGFVCGIVATLVDANIGGQERPLAYLSTAMASTVCIARAEYGLAVQAVRAQMGPARTY